MMAESNEQAEFDKRIRSGLREAQAMQKVLRILRDVNRRKGPRAARGVLAAVTALHTHGML